METTQIKTAWDGGQQGPHAVHQRQVRLQRRSRSQQIITPNKQPMLNANFTKFESSKLDLSPDKHNGIRPQSCVPPDKPKIVVIPPFQRPNTRQSVDCLQSLLYSQTEQNQQNGNSKKLRRLSLQTDQPKFKGERRLSFGTRRSRSRSSSFGSIDSGQPCARARSNSMRLSRGSGLVKLNDFQEVKEDEDQKEREKRLRKKLHRALRMVQIFSSFCIGIRQYAEQEQSAEYDLYCLLDMLPSNKEAPTPVQESSLYFNKHVFARNNTLHFPLWARWTCALAPGDRSEAEVNKLVTLLRGMKSFNRFSREAQKNLCRTMTYACYERRRVIVRQGHPGFCFYFIVSGRVSVTVTQQDWKTGISVTKTVDTLEKNDAFGEIALMTEDARRTATVTCRERVEVLIVNRETVMEYCPDIFQKEFQEKYDVLKSHELFKRLNHEALEYLCHESHIKELAHGKLVDADSTASDALYFIIRGKIEMLRSLDLNDVLGSSASVNVFGSCPLPRPVSSRPQHGIPSVQFVNVGSLYKRDAWDLQTLFHKPPDEPGNILVSAGVRFLRVPKTRFLKLTTKEDLEEFEINFVPKHRCPSSKELYEKYLAAQSWIEYRHKVVQNVMDFKRGHLIAHVPCSAKGTSGWGAWPGRKPRQSANSVILSEDKCI